MFGKRRFGETSLFRRSAEMSHLPRGAKARTALFAFHSRAVGALWPVPNILNEARAGR